MNVLVAGLGKLGAVMAGLLANAEHTVIGVDSNTRTRKAINDGVAPVDEPGLDLLIGGLPRGQLTATDDWAAAVSQTDLAMIVVPTPSLPAGGFDSSLVVDVVTRIGEALRSERARTTPYCVVVCSTLMPGAMLSQVTPALEKASGLTLGDGVCLAYSPEFIALGTVIRDMAAPDMVLIGAQDSRSASTVVALSQTFRTPSAVHTMPFTAAELTKLAINGYLSTKIGYANMIGAAAEELGCAPQLVLDAVGADKRIGKAFLRKGGPPTGPCLPRDLVALETLAAETGVPMPLATAARQAARDVIDRCIAQLEPHVKRVAILGVAYKPGSPVTDDSLARSLITLLHMRGIQINTYDPHAQIPSSFVWEHRRYDNLAGALRDAHAVIIGCPHPEFDDLEPGPLPVVNPWV